MRKRLNLTREQAILGAGRGYMYNRNRLIVKQEQANMKSRKELNVE